MRIRIFLILSFFLLFCCNHPLRNHVFIPDPDLPASINIIEPDEQLCVGDAIFPEAEVLTSVGDLWEYYFEEMHWQVDGECVVFDVSDDMFHFNCDECVVITARYQEMQAELVVEVEWCE